MSSKGCLSAGRRLERDGRSIGLEIQSTDSNGTHLPHAPQTMYLSTRARRSFGHCGATVGLAGATATAQWWCDKSVINSYDQPRCRLSLLCHTRLAGRLGVN